MEALLEVHAGEQVYKFMNSKWLTDEEGLFLYRFISKRTAEGTIELVLFKQRQNNLKVILDRFTFPEVEFLGKVQEIRQAIWQLYPDAVMEVLEMDDIPATSVHKVKNTRLGSMCLHLHWFWGRVKMMLGRFWRWFRD